MAETNRPGQGLISFKKEYLVGGIPTPLKNDGVQVSWDYCSQLFMESHNPFMFQTTNQIYILPAWVSIP